MRTRMLLNKIIVLSCGLSAAPLGWAGFSTQSTDWPNNASIVDEKYSAPVVPVVVDPVQEACFKPMKRAPEVMKMYVKFGINQGDSEIRHVRNQSYSPLNNLKVSNYSMKKVGLDWEIGVGTKVNDIVRFELEYIHHKTINYDAVPVLIGNSAGLSSQVMNYSALLNMYIDYNKLDYFRPYFGVLTGLVWNKTRTAVQGGGYGTAAAENENHYGLAWGLTVGARMPFWSRWFAYFGYRYTSLNKMYWKDSTNILQLNGQYVYSGVFLGVQILVGS